MRIFPSLAAVALVATLGTAALRPAASARPSLAPVDGEATRNALAQARGEGARARERAAAFDRQARAATLAGERATLATAALGARVQQAEAALAGSVAQLALLRRQREALDRRLARERAPVSRLLAGLQTQVRRPPLLTVLQPGSIEDAVHLRAVLATVGPQIAAQTTSLRGALEHSRVLERDAGRIAAQQHELRAELLARRTQLATVSAAERIKARRAAGAADREAERALAAGEQARDLTSLLGLLRTPGGEAVTPASSGHAAQAGPSPYRLPVSGRIDPSPAAVTLGLTLIARPDALIVAPAAGRVAFAGPFRGFGAIVIVEHAEGWTSLITGLGTVRVAVGQALVAGSPLGHAPSGAPRIGLELRRNGQRVNPLDHLS